MFKLLIIQFLNNTKIVEGLLKNLKVYNDVNSLCYYFYIAKLIYNKSRETIFYLQTIFFNVVKNNKNKIQQNNNEF